MPQTAEQIETTVKLVQVLVQADRWRNDPQGITQLPSTGHWMPVIGTTVERNGAYATEFINCDNIKETKAITSPSPASKEFTTLVNGYLKVLHKGFLTYDNKMEKEINESTTIVDTLQRSLEQPAHETKFDIFKALSVSTNEIVMHGITEDTTAVLKNVGLGMEVGSLAAEMMPAQFSTVMGAATLTLNLAETAIAIYELTQVNNELEKAEYIARTVGGGVNSVLGAVSLATVFIKAPVVASFAGALSVPAFGLCFGITELMKLHGRTADKVAHVGSVFNKLHDGYKCSYLYNNQIKALYYPYGSVVRKIDLQDQTLHFDSQLIYSSSVKTGLLSSNQPVMDVDKDKALNFRDVLDLRPIVPLIDNSPESRAAGSQAARILILPTTPKSYIRYTYDNLLGATNRNDTGFHEVLIPLQNTKKFIFRSLVLISEYIIDSITEDYISTPIEVVLGNSPFRLEIPKVEGDMRDKLHYTIRGRPEGRCTIGLRDGVALTLCGAPSGKMLWILDATKLPGSTIQVTRTKSTVGNMFVTKLIIGDMKIIIDQYRHCGAFILSKHAGYWSVDFEKCQSNLLWIDAKQFPTALATKGEHPLMDYLKTLSPAVIRTQVVRIENYSVQERSGGVVVVGRAYYDLRSHTMYYTYVPKSLRGSGAWSHSALLGPAFVGSDGRRSVYFYNTEKAYLWRTLAGAARSSGTNIEATYSTPFFGECKIVKVWTECNEVLAMYSHQETDYALKNYIYRVGPTDMTLLRIVDHYSKGIYDIEDKTTTSGYFKSSRSPTQHPLAEVVTKVTAKMNTYVDILSLHSGQRHVWVRKDRLFACLHLSDKTLDDMKYVGSTVRPKTHYFYAPHPNKIYSCNQRYGNWCSLELVDYPDHVRNTSLNPSIFSDALVVIVDGSYIFRGDGQKNLQFGGVYVNGFTGKRGWELLDIYARTHRYHLIPVFGVKDRQSNALDVWYHYGKFIGGSADLNQATVLRLNTQGTVAWLSSQQKHLYRQVVRTVDEFCNALDNDRKTLVAPFNAKRVLPVSYNEIQVTSNGYRVAIDGGVSLDIDETGAATVFAVDKTWDKQNPNLDSGMEKLSNSWSCNGVVIMTGLVQPSWYHFGDCEKYSLPLHWQDRPVWVGLAHRPSNAVGYVFAHRNGILYKISQKGATYIDHSFHSVKRIDKTLLLHPGNSHKALEIPEIADIDSLIVIAGDSNFSILLTPELLNMYPSIFIGAGSGIITIGTQALKLKFTVARVGVTHRIQGLPTGNSIIICGPIASGSATPKPGEVFIDSTK